MPEVRCPVDGTRFHIPPSHLARLKTEPTCSPECRAEHMRGANHWNYSADGRYTDSDGYVRVRTPDGWDYEHRVVMRKRLHRALRPNELVKHRNGKRADNRPSNLYIAKQRQAGAAVQTSAARVRKGPKTGHI